MSIVPIYVVASSGSFLGAVTSHQRSTTVGNTPKTPAQCQLGTSEVQFVEAKAFTQDNAKPALKPFRSWFTSRADKVQYCSMFCFARDVGIHFMPGRALLIDEAVKLTCVSAMWRNVVLLVCQSFFPCAFLHFGWLLSLLCSSSRCSQAFCFSFCISCDFGTCFFVYDFSFLLLLRRRSTRVNVLGFSVSLWCGHNSSHATLSMRGH